MLEILIGLIILFVLFVLGLLMRLVFVGFLTLYNQISEDYRVTIQGIGTTILLIFFMLLACYWCGKCVLLWVE